ncbi:hypothetical protein PIIN_08906 [Serendipita indica DSM 11827]|uniref:Uncharacterized protein n=1 Tax=Serendipita indica (strain DSM 11827) TaxID=1109443 RepID=G4U354_SERID|nr:hypothetical protein PIIN_08906 [Serendipita indica DSM 11827]
MARTRQTSRKSTGGKAPRKQLSSRWIHTHANKTRIKCLRSSSKRVPGAVPDHEAEFNEPAQTSLLGGTPDNSSSSRHQELLPSGADDTVASSVG